MTLQKWQAHIDGILPDGIKRPSIGGNKETWKAWYNQHINIGCQDCKDRMKTRKAGRAAKMKHQALVDLGLIRVRGALGGIYYE